MIRSNAEPEHRHPADAQHDLRLILAVQGIRAFGYGFGSVLMGVALAAGGLTGAQVGAIFTAMLAGMAGASMLVGRFGDRFGRRRTYVLLLMLMAIASAAFALSQQLPILILAALTGTLSTDPNESGPITTVEQTIIGSAPAVVRVRVFGRYNAIAYLTGSIGALLAGGPDALRVVWPGLPADQRWLLVLSVSALAAAWLASRLSGRIEPARSDARSGGLVRSRTAVRRLASLFALDAFAGGFIVQAFLAFWFSRQFGATPLLMGAVFFGVGVLQAGSSLAAGWLGGRFGLLNTMVFTHLPSNLLLVAIAFAPGLPLAIVLLLARSVLSQMDVPARQAFLVAMVDPGERLAATGYTNTARYVARPAAPLTAGTLTQLAWAGWPLVIAGGLKIAYDLTLYVVFRRAQQGNAESD